MTLTPSYQILLEERLKENEKSMKNYEENNLGEFFDLLNKIDKRIESETPNTLLNGRITDNEKQEGAIHQRSYR